MLDVRCAWSVAAADEFVVRVWPNEAHAVLYAVRQRTTHLIDADTASILECLGTDACSVGNLATRLAADWADLPDGTALLDELVGMLQALQGANLLVLRPC
jgi:hypothetical protein